MWWLILSVLIVFAIGLVLIGREVASWIGDDEDDEWGDEPPSEFF